MENNIKKVSVKFWGICYIVQHFVHIFNLPQVTIFIILNLTVSSNFIFYISSCTTTHRHPIFSTRYSVMCKVYNGYRGTSEIEHGLCVCTVDNPRALALAQGLSLRTGAQTMLYLSLMAHLRSYCSRITKDIHNKATFHVYL